MTNLPKFYFVASPVVFGRHQIQVELLYRRFGIVDFKNRSVRENKTQNLLPLSFWELENLFLSPIKLSVKHSTEFHLRNNITIP